MKSYPLPEKPTGRMSPPDVNPDAHQANLPGRVDPAPIDTGLELPPAEAILAQELRALAASTHPDDEFVARLEGELARQRRAAPARRAPAPTLAVRLRAGLRAAWGWTLPAGAVVLVILVVSLLLQVRPSMKLTGSQNSGHPSAPTAPQKSLPPTDTPPSLSDYRTGNMKYYYIQPGDTLEGIADRFGVTIEALLDANRLESWGVPYNGMQLIIPASATYPLPNDMIHTVRYGETLSYIADHFGVTVDSLLAANRLEPGAEPRVGMTLILPQSSAYPGPKGATYTVQEGDTLVGIARKFNLTVESLLAANPLKIGGLPSVGMLIIIPEGDRSLYPAPVDPATLGEFTYTVQIGDTLAKIAGQYGVSAEAILNANQLEGLGMLPVGLSLIIPATGVTVGPNDSAYVVKEGDTLLGIAEYFGVSMDKLRLANALEWDRISTGQRLIIPSPAMPVDLQGELYTVEEGDTLVSIADRFGVSVDHLMAANNLWNDASLAVGRGLVIPHWVAGTPFPSRADRQSEPASLYTVREGDTLESIARQFGITVETLCELNDLLPDSIPYVGQVLTITLDVFIPLPTPAAAGPTSDTPALLAELQGLVEKRSLALLKGPGWIFQNTHTTNTSDCGGVILPMGLFYPCELDEYNWYELNARGEVVTTITRQFDPSGNLFQESITRDGLTRNFTFGYEATATLTYTYTTDWGFAALAAEAVAEGALLSKLPPSAGAVDDDPVGYVVWVDGEARQEAIFHPQSGALLTLVRFTPGQGGSQPESIVTILSEWRIDQPPAEASALLDRSFASYQPPPSQGIPVPPGYDLASSTLSFKTIAGDNFNGPSFWYGDIYADGVYLVGRVDFGYIPGGFCQRSPDGLKIAFDHVSLLDDITTVHQLRWIDLRALNDIRIPPFDLQLVSPPAWDPGSAYLAFNACDIGQRCGLYTYDTYTGILQRLADGGNATPPVWSPGGVEIAYQTGPGEAPQTAVVDAASGVVIANPSWQPQFPAEWSGFSRCESPPALLPTRPTATPTAFVTAAPAMLVVAAQQGWAPVYTGPGQDYQPAGEVASGLSREALGRTVDGSWIACDQPGSAGQIAWIAAGDVELSGPALPELPVPPRPAITPAPAAPPDALRIAGRIAFISLRDGYPVLYAVNPDGSGLTVLVNDLGMLMEPVWSPDGGQLAFSATSPHTHDIAAFAVGAGGGAWSELAAEAVPAWVPRSELSPDGTRKVYVEADENGLASVFVSNADGSNAVNLSGGEPDHRDAASPAWSPDGSQVVYIAWQVDDGGRYIGADLFIAHADGVQRTRVASNVSSGWPSWSPDGQYITYAAGGDIYVVHPADQQTWRLTEHPADDYAPAWSPAASLAPLPGERPAAPVTPAYTDGDEDLAYLALQDFLSSLNSGDYAQAVALYGGEYSMLVDYNWGLDPRDKLTLLQNACQVNGFQCLQVRGSSWIARSLPDRYVFQVEFNNADGSLFVQGPCCGGSVEDFPPVSQFEFVVVKVAEGQFVVLTLPPLLP